MIIRAASTCLCWAYSLVSLDNDRDPPEAATNPPDLHQTFRLVTSIVENSHVDEPKYSPQP